MNWRSGSHRCASATHSLPVQADRAAASKWRIGVSQATLVGGKSSETRAYYACKAPMHTIGGVRSSTVLVYERKHSKTTRIRT